MPKRRLSLSAPLPRDSRSSLDEIDGENHLIISFPSPPLALPDGLSDAERAIAHLLLSGLSNEEIAHARRRKVSTVTKQVASVFRKLGVCSRAELAARARGGATS